MVFSFEWKKNPNEWLGMMQDRSAADAGQMSAATQFGAGGQQAEMLAQQNAGLVEPTQQAGMLAQQNAGLLSPEDSVQQVASSMPNAPDSANVDLGADFDLGAITDSLGKLGGGGDDFKFDKPNMQLMKVGGNSQGYQSMAQQPVQPLSTAMGAISSPQQTMAAAGQPQQDEQINMMRRMLGLA